MAFYTAKTTTAKSIFKALIIMFIIMILVVVRKNLCMTPQDLALRCISANHGLNNWDPMEVCALLSFLTVLLGLSYAGESILDIVVAAWEREKEQGGAEAPDEKKTGGLPAEAIVGIVAGVVVLLVGGVGFAIYGNRKAGLDPLINAGGGGGGGNGGGGG